MNNHVPFLDLVTPHVNEEEALLNVCREALRTGRFIGGPMVEEFEQLVRRVLRREVLRGRRERHRCAPVRADRGRGPAEGHRRHGPQYLHCDDGGDLPGRRLSDVHRHRSADLQHGPEAPAGVPERAVHDRSEDRRDRAPQDRTPGIRRDTGAPVRADGGHGRDPSNWPNGIG